MSYLNTTQFVWSPNSSTTESKTVSTRPLYLQSTFADSWLETVREVNDDTHSLGAHRLRCLFHLPLGPQILQIDTLGILNIVDDLTLATCLATEVLYVQLPFAEASYVITTI